MQPERRAFSASHRTRRSADRERDAGSHIGVAGRRRGRRGAARRRGHSEAAAASRSSGAAEPEMAELRVRPPELEPKRAGGAAGLVLPPLAGGGTSAGAAGAGGGGGYGGGRPSLSRASPLSLSLSPCSLRAPIPPIHSLRLGCFLAAHRSCGCPPVGTAAAAGAAAAALRARQRRRRRRLRRLRLPLVC